MFNATYIRPLYDMPSLYPSTPASAPVQWQLPSNVYISGECDSFIDVSSAFHYAKAIFERIDSTLPFLPLGVEPPQARGSNKSTGAAAEGAEVGEEEEYIATALRDAQQAALTEVHTELAI